jgi:hypothetical protein
MFDLTTTDVVLIQVGVSIAFFVWMWWSNRL